ncbi:antitoxin Xre/MbcA/ParS toxin-binding domain-containing protein [Kaarinaea lacus]
MLENLSHEQKIELTHLIMQMLDEWGVSHSDKITLLALPSRIRIRMVRRFYENEALPDEVAVFERIDHLLGIADALRTSFPLNGHMAAFWLNQKNHRFENKTPLDYMLEGGLENVVAVRAHLDCAWDWHRSGSASQ